MNGLNTFSKNLNGYTLALIFLCLFIVFFAYLTFPGENFYDSKRIFQFITLFVVSITAFLFLYEKNKPAKRPSMDAPLSKNICILLGVFIVAGSISVLLSTYPGYALLEVLFLFLIFGFIALLVPTTTKQHYFLGLSLHITVTLFSLIYLTIFFGNYIGSFFNPFIPIWPEMPVQLQITYEGVEQVIENTHEVLYFLNKRFFNHIQTWSIPLLTGLFLYLREKKGTKSIQAALFLLIAFWWMLVFAAGSRGTTAAVLGSSLVLVLFLRSGHKSFLKSNFSLAAIGAGLYFLLFELPKSGSGEPIPIMRTTPGSRLGYLSTSLEKWLAEPFFGYGPMHFAKMEGIFWGAHPHNFYLQILTEWGLIAFLAMGGLIFIFSKAVRQNYNQNIKTRSRRNNIIYYSVIWSLIAGFLHAFVGGIMHTPMSQILLILIISWLLGFQIRGKNYTSWFNLNKRHVNIILLAILIIVIILSVQLPFYEDYINIGFPRFWSNGHF